MNVFFRKGHRFKFLIFIAVLGIHLSKSWALNPDTEITLHLKNVKLNAFLKAIENSTRYSFIYNEDILANKKITVEVKKEPLQKVLNQVFEKENITFRFSGNHILLQKEKERSGKRKYTISGYVTDNSSSETLLGANIYDQINKQGTTTNSYGFYSLTFTEGDIELNYSYIGYQNQQVKFNLRKDTVINAKMVSLNMMQEVIVLSNKPETGLKSTQMGATNIPLEMIYNNPVVLGEPDIMKTIQLIPGVQGGTEGTAGIHVRGGGPDQNLILLDGVPLYNAEHLFGFFSVFTPEAIKKVNFFKGSFPARFGGRLSSVIDIRTNDGNMEKYHGTFSIGLLSSRIHFEGPLIKNKTSFNFSARRTYIDFFLKPLLPEKNKVGYYFYDINAKVNQKFNEKNRLFFSMYHGKDKYSFNYSSTNIFFSATANPDYSLITPQERTQFEDKMKESQNITWGNTVTAIRWNHIFNQKLFSNTTIAYNNYFLNNNYKHHQILKESFPTNIKENHYNSDYDSGIKDLSYNMDFEFNPNPNQQIRFGMGYIYHDFNPEIHYSKIKETESGITNDIIYNPIPSTRKYAHESSLYLEDNFNIGEKIQINVGIHSSLFNIDNKTYFSFQPRLSARYEPVENIAFKAAYNKMSQYVQLLTSSSALSMPTDIWVPTTGNIRPMTSHQYAAGIYYSGIPGWEFSVEGYYKNISNVLEYKDGAHLSGNSANWEEKVEMGKGRSFGTEFQIQKISGKTTGSLSYTLAKADRKFSIDGINEGKRFPYKYDRRHTAHITINYKLTNRIDLTASWTYASGNVTTIGDSQTAIIRPGNAVKNYFISPIVSASENNTISHVPYISSRNNFRLPASHRLNIGANFRKKTKNGERIWNISLYNAYNAMNPNFLYWDSYYYNMDGRGNYKLTKLTLLPILPSFSYTYKF